MAGQSDVMNKLVGMIAAVLYPNGTGQPSIAGLGIKIYEGWPVPNVLETDLKAGKAHVSVYPSATERQTTRELGRAWVQIVPPAHTVVATVSGNQITLSGTVSAQNLLASVNGSSYVYTMQVSDTLTSAATALSALIPGATSSGPVITISGAHSVLARVGGFGTAIKETKRQEKQFQISIWAPRPDARDSVVNAIDSALSDSTNLPLPDGSSGIMRYSHSFQTDQLQKAGLYRIDLFYKIDFATTQTTQAAEVIAPVLNMTNAQTGQPITTLNP
ncbi:hypothetical protein [Pseudomonas sp. MWU12-2345]|uniref:hypothetical protein n=1 Tax=Pseudomonas sp. MWU12-2345 TaxID=2928689 RepID=UPI00200CDBFA|nr:hypothetical protein [Pseudomonas sp. MWU12-2345]